MSLPPPSPQEPDSAQFSQGEFTRDERTELLRLAHESILSAFERREISLEPPTSHFAELRGTFTSLYLDSALRGCVGYVLPMSSVYRTVAETARAAAFEDMRFPPVKLEEARHLDSRALLLVEPKPHGAQATRWQMMRWLSG